MLIPHTDDRRVLFAIPWHDRVLVGTTETPVAEPAIEPRPLPEEVQYLLDYLARYLVRRPSAAEIQSVFAGLRPLLRGSDTQGQTARLSREHAVVIADSGLITITGGKWTTYRRMAIDAVDQAIRVGGLAPRPPATEQLHLHGWHAPTDPDGSLAMYGSDAPQLRALCAEHPDWDRPLHPALPYQTVEVVWAARSEAARSVEDVLARRTRALFLDARASIEAAPGVAALLAGELGRNPDWQDRQVARFGELARGYLVGAG
jgi:glycerol-3-phosphate dehydrogenase